MQVLIYLISNVVPSQREHVLGEIKLSLSLYLSLYLSIYLQKDFIEDGRPMLVKGGKYIVPNVIKAVDVARQRGILIVWVTSFFLCCSLSLDNDLSCWGRWG